MAVITPPRLTQLRQALAVDFPNPAITKPTMNAAFQAIEDRFETAAFKTALSTAIDTATAPVILPAAVKAKLVKHWLKWRFDNS